jgi:hypothetical protein
MIRFNDMLLKAWKVSLGEAFHVRFDLYHPYIDHLVTV